MKLLKNETYKEMYCVKTETIFVMLVEVFLQSCKRWDQPFNHTLFNYELSNAKINYWEVPFFLLLIVVKEVGRQPTGKRNVCLFGFFMEHGNGKNCHILDKVGFLKLTTQCGHARGCRGNNFFSFHNIFPVSSIMLKLSSKTKIFDNIVSSFNLSRTSSLSFFFFFFISTCCIQIQ